MHANLSLCNTTVNAFLKLILGSVSFFLGGGVMKSLVKCNKQVKAMINSTDNFFCWDAFPFNLSHSALTVAIQ